MVDLLYYTTYNITKIIILRNKGVGHMAIQLGGNLLEACVLAVVRKEDVYGYRLTQEVREALDISESTLYPVLRRLQKDGFLHTYDEPYQGRNRRYYQITASGHQKYSEFIQEWDEYKQKIDYVLMGGKEDE